MSHESLWLQIPEIILIPLFALFIITLIKAATAKAPWGNDDAVDIGMDLAILATGACGAIFANEKLYIKFGIGLIVYGILTVLVCIVFVGVLAVIRRWRNTNVGTGTAIRNVFIGLAPLLLVTALLILGYNYTPGR
jgi:hypothetical protein